MRGRGNLLNWDGVGTPEGMFPPRHDGDDGKRAQA
jgi:nitrate reductase beta subunit